MKLDHRGLFSVQESQCRGVPWPQGTSGAGRHPTGTSCQVVSLKLQELTVCLASLGNLLEWLFIVEESLNTAIHGCWIGCDGLVLWPAMSSGLTSHDFFTVELCKNTGFYWWSQNCWQTEKKNRASCVNSHSCHTVDQNGSSSFYRGKEGSALQIWP